MEKTKIRAILITLIIVQILLFSPMIGIAYPAGNTMAIGNSPTQNEVYLDESVFARERYDMQYIENVAFDSIGPASAYFPGEILIKIAPHTKINPIKSAMGMGVGEASLDSLMQKHGVYSIQRIFKGSSEELARWYEIEFPKSVDVDSAVKEFSQNPRIECAQPNYIYSYDLAPNDSYYYEQWALNNIGQNYSGVERTPGAGNDEQVSKNGTYDSDIDAPEAWDISLGRKEVVVAVIDSGVDYNHEDIAANIWINPGEDLNDNGVVDPGPPPEGDFDGNDTDGNGYIDDIRGYDFFYNDNDPMDFHGHGTHVAGTIAALTNNSIGIAGVAGNVTIMPLKVGPDGGGYLSGMEKAIEYAADNGAKILSNSWGSIFPGFRDQAVEDAIEYAYNKGCVVVFAAGNDNSRARYYPAAGDYVVAVAATNSTDQRTWFSNYGDWVDICAPGDDILSLRANGTDIYAPGEPNVHIFQPNDKYYIASGTSMATPHVSGVAALIASKFPQDSNEEIISRLLSTADNIDGINPDYSGWLGTGRVNAYEALSTPPRPNLVLKSFVVDDFQGDGDGRVDPGETVQLTITLENLWIAATNVVANLSSIDPYVTILDSTSSFGDISNGSTGVSETPYTVSFSTDLPFGHSVTFKLSIVADNGYTDIDYFLISISIFVDVTYEAGVPGDPYPYQGNDVIFGDYDNDGWLDIFVSGHGLCKSILYHNNGNGTFTDVTFQAGLNGTEYKAWCAASGDYDNDGNLDIYIGNQGGNTLYHNNGDGTFTNVTEQAGVGDTRDATDVIFGDYDNDGWLDIYVVNRYKELPPPDPNDVLQNVLYRNNGDGTFTNVATEARVNDPEYGNNAIFFDYDNDSFLDIYIANVFGYNVLYHNNGNGTFTDVTEQASVAGWQDGDAWDVAAADYDNDGFLDMYVSFWGTDSPGSILYHNNGNGTFEDRAVEAGVVGVTDAIKVLWGDYDNDGDQDLLATEFNRPNRLFRNNGDGTFADVSRLIENNLATKTFGAGFGDYDNDGYIDLYLTPIGFEENTLYKNKLRGNNWLIIKTIGEVSNRDGIGTKVTVKTGTLWQTQEVSASSGNSIPLEFGLGSYVKADLVRVTWPSGIVSEFSNVDTNQIINIFEANDFESDLNSWEPWGNGNYTLSRSSSGMNSTYAAYIAGDGEGVNAGMHKAFKIDGRLMLSFDWRAASNSDMSTYTNAYLKVTDENESVVVYETALIEGGTTDSGWQHFSKDLSKYVTGNDVVNIILYLKDSWAENLQQKNWYDNVKVAGLATAVRNLTVLAEDQFGNPLLSGDVYIDDMLVGYTGSNFTVFKGQRLVFVNDFWESNTTGYRYGFDHWEDGSENNSRWVNVLENTTVTAHFMKRWCPGDIDGNGAVDDIDFDIFSAAYGSDRGDLDWDSRADLDSDRDVDSYDFYIFSGKYGQVYTHQLTVLAEDQQGNPLLTIPVYIDGDFVGYTGSNFTVWPDHEIYVTTPHYEGDDEYEFKKWENDSRDNPRTLTIDADITITAYYKRK